MSWTLCSGEGRRTASDQIDDVGPGLRATERDLCLAAVGKSQRPVVRVVGIEVGDGRGPGPLPLLGAQIDVDLDLGSVAVDQGGGSPVAAHARIFSSRLVWTVFMKTHPSVEVGRSRSCRFDSRCGCGV